MDSYYEKLPLEQLLPEIRESVEVMDFHRAGIDSEMRARLLPALKALREKTKRQKPGFYDHLRAMGLTPGRVKMWFHRANAGAEIEALVEEQESRQDAEDDAGVPKPPKSARLSPEQQDRLIAVGTIASRALEARKNGKSVEAEQLDRELDIILHEPSVDQIIKAYDPGYKAMLLDLLTQFKKQNYKAAAVKQHCLVVEERLQAFKLKAMTEHDLVEEVRARGGGLSVAAAMEYIAKARVALPDADNETVFVNVCVLLTEVA